jgi:predicted small metal-binding protein
MATTSTRVFIDCSEQPSDSACTLYIAGSRDEVLKAAVQHAVASHGHKDTPELRKMLESGLKPEAA